MQPYISGLLFFIVATVCAWLLTLPLKRSLKLTVTQQLIMVLYPSAFTLGYTLFAVSGAVQVWVSSFGGLFAILLIYLHFSSALTLRVTRMFCCLWYGLVTLVNHTISVLLASLLVLGIGSLF